VLACTSCGRRWLVSDTPTRSRPPSSRTVRLSSSPVCRIALDTSSVVSSAAVSTASGSAQLRSRSVTSQRATVALSAVGGSVRCSSVDGPPLPAATRWPTSTTVSSGACGGSSPVTMSSTASAGAVGPPANASPPSRSSPAPGT
jgi:hypothetical protein